MGTQIGDATSISQEKLDTAAFVRWVLPTVVLQPFHNEAELTLDAIRRENKPQLSPDACQRLTGLLWPSFVESIRQGQDVDADEAKTQLKEKDHAFVRPQYDHVVFKHSNNVFVAEYTVDGSCADVLRCWKSPSSDIHPATVYVTFKDVAEKQDFDRLARALGYRSDALILSLARDFAGKLAGLRKPEGE